MSDEKTVWTPVPGRLALAIVLLLGVCVWSGCEDDDDKIYDHVPPEGKGTLVVDNDTADDINVYVNGVRKTRAGDGSESFTELDPGLYRVVLDGEDDRSWRNDVDILEGRLTILHVRTDFSHPREYDVDVELY